MTINPLNAANFGPIQHHVTPAPTKEIGGAIGEVAKNRLSQQKPNGQTITAKVSDLSKGKPSKSKRGLFATAKKVALFVGSRLKPVAVGLVVLALGVPVLLLAACGYACKKSATKVASVFSRTKISPLSHSPRPSLQSLKKKLEFSESSRDLRKLEKKGRKGGDKRERYFDGSNEKLKTIYSIDGYKNTFPQRFEQMSELEQNQVSELSSVSQESYINLTLVYRFDGPEMQQLQEKFTFAGEGGQVDTYQVTQYFEEAQGMVGYGLSPLQRDDGTYPPPRLIFRGTSSNKIRNRLDTANIKLPTGKEADMQHNIGKKSYEKKGQEITEWLKAQPGPKGEKGAGKAKVSGHSLGGVYAQRVAADPSNQGLVGEVFTLASPMLDSETIEAAESAGINPDLKITHVVMENDPVPMAGDLLLKSPNSSNSSVYKFRGKGISPSEAHTSRLVRNIFQTGEVPPFEKVSVEKYQSRIKFYSNLVNTLRTRK